MSFAFSVNIQIPKKDFFFHFFDKKAIFCKLIGIRPLNNSTEWCDTICDTIYDTVLSQPSYFLARPIRLSSPDKYTYGLRSCSYDVVLLDETGGVNINNWIVNHQHGEFEPETSHFLDILFEYASLEEIDFSRFVVEFDDDDMMKLVIQTI